MSTQVQLRRGTVLEHASFTGAVGEVTVDTTNNTLRVHDNATAGGHSLARSDFSNVLVSSALNLGSNALTGVTSINGGPTPGQNAIINGDFRFNQRGAASYSGGVYGLDRWKSNAIGSSLTHSQQTFTLGQTDVPGEPKHYARCVVTSVAGTSNNAIYLQWIEGVRTFAGQTITLSFWAKADAAKDIAVEFVQDFGTGGSYSANVLGIGSQLVDLTTTWQQHSVTVTLPSISGKTLGTNQDDKLGLLFWLDAGSDWNARTNTLGQQSGTFDFADVQLKLGSTVTPYDRVDDATELARCQRYYEKSYNLDTAPGALTNIGCSTGPTQNGGLNSAMIDVRFGVTKRAAPTFTTYNPVNGTAGQMVDGGNAVSNATAYFTGRSGCLVLNTGSSFAANNRARFQWTADAEL